MLLTSAKHFSTYKCWGLYEFEGSARRGKILTTIRVKMSFGILAQRIMVLCAETYLQLTGRIRCIRSAQAEHVHDATRCPRANTCILVL
jgi:hypothetical protein